MKNRTFSGSVRIATYASNEKLSVNRRGGYSKISVFDLNELESIQSTGNPAKAAPASRAMITRTFMVIRRRARVIVVVMAQSLARWCRT